MGKIKLAVVGDTSYARRLTECIRKNAPEYLEVLGCQCVQDLADFLIKMQPDILLCEREAAAGGRLVNYIVRIWLTDTIHGEQGQACGQDGGIAQTQIRQDPEIFRYQRGSEILRQVFQIYEKHSKKNLVCRCNNADMEMDAFYAPGGNELLLPYSISYASICGEEAKTLYLNLSEFSGMASFFGEKAGKNLSDLIYAIRQKKDRFLISLQSVLHHTEQFDYILPPENPEDLYEIQEEDLASLLKMLQEQTEYTQIVWGCGTFNQAVEQVMECCRKVYCVVKESSFGKYRKIEFEGFLKKEWKRRIQEKVVFISTQTGSGVFVPGMDILAQLQSGEFAEQVRKLTQEEQGESG